MSKQTGGPAFPTTTDVTFESPKYTEYGMTLRDYFAAAAMQGMIVNPEAGSFLVELAKQDDVLLSVGEMSYRISDAMIQERGK